MDELERVNHTFSKIVKFLISQNVRHINRANDMIPVREQTLKWGNHYIRASVSTIFMYDSLGKLVAGIRRSQGGLWWVVPRRVGTYVGRTKLIETKAIHNESYLRSLVKTFCDYELNLDSDWSSK